MMAQPLALSLVLKAEARRPVLLDSRSSLLESRLTGLALGAGGSLFMHANAAERNALWTLFSDVKAEHSR